MITSRHLALATSSLLMLAGCSRPTAAPPAPPEVTVATAESRVIQNWDEYTGRLEAVEHVALRPRVSGHIDAVRFTEGRTVRAGELLFEIDPRPYRAAHDRARAGLVHSRTVQDLARLELKRVEAMSEGGAVSQEEVDQRASALAQADALVASAQAALDAAALELSFTRIESPIDGRVSRAEVTRGNLVSGSATGGTLLTTVVSEDPIYVYFDGDERAFLGYSRLLQRGDWPTDRALSNAVELGLADEADWPRQGRLDFVDNQLNPQTGTIRARARFDNKDAFLKPGMFARVRLLASGEHPAVLVPDRAIGSDQSQTFVLVVQPDSIVAYRPVKLGRLVEGMRVVIDGVQAGERVIVSGLHRVRPGMPVTPTPAAAAATALVVDGARSAP
jgi:RND family efflux transporter MFP subunit